MTLVSLREDCYRRIKALKYARDCTFSDVIEGFLDSYEATNNPDNRISLRAGK